MNLSWKDEYSTGNDSLDYEHKILLGIIEKITFVTDDLNELEKILKDFQRYVKAHFINEEIYMEYIKFENLEEHKKEHKKLGEKIISFIDKFKTYNAEELKKEIVVFLKNDCLKHVLVEDAKIRNFKTN